MKTGYIFIIMGIAAIITPFIPRTSMVNGNKVTEIGGQPDVIIGGIALIGIGMILLKVTK